jgi:baseplate J-like protein
MTTMAKECYDTDLLANSGTNQAERALPALAPSYARVDERSLADLILFAKKYAAYLNYYDLTNNISGDWQRFMENDVAVATAAIAALNTNDYYTYIDNLYAYTAAPTAPMAVPAYPDPKQTFTYIFDFIASIASLLNQSLPYIPSDTGYSPFLLVSIGSKLAAPLQLLADYYTYLNSTIPPASPVNPAAPATDPSAPVDPLVKISSLNFLGSAPWTYTIPSPNPLYAIYYAPGLNTNEIYRQIVADPVFTGTINDFLNGIAYIVNQTASTWLNAILTQYPKHTPHYTLYLSFLQIFQSARDHLNEYTGRHLEFYFRKVLQLTNNPGIPDNVHATFTLQKNTVQHLLSAGTRLKAGKDANSNDLFYALTSDIVLNQTSVQALRSLFLLKNSDSSGTTTLQLYASPIANSADGQGGKLTSTDKSWYPFGDLNNPVFSANTASIGFAIASDLLYLAEGNRVITLSFNVTYNGTQSPTFTMSPDAFSIQFTGPGKWFSATDPNYLVTSNTSFIATSWLVKMQIAINGNAPAIVPYSPKIHGGNFPQALPMIQVQLTEPDYLNYSFFKALTINSITLDVSVDAVQNLVLQNDDGKIDPSKPFKPFGQFPESGASFIIGSKEVFIKTLTKLSIAIGWQGTTPTDTVNLQYLSGGQWIPGPTATQISTNLNAPDFTGMLAELFGPGITAVSVRIPIITLPDFTPNQPYTKTTANGFINLSLQTSQYNLSNYLGNVQTAAASNTVTITTVAASGSTPASTTFKLNPPGTPTPMVPSPVADSISLGYSAETIFLDSTAGNPLLNPGNKKYNPEEDFNTRQNYFYHIEPFGFREIHPYLMPVPSATNPTAPDDQLNFLPVFNLDNLIGSTADTGTADSPDNGGELWIGLSGAIPGETHSILFQVSEGSSNPLRDITTVTWYYLSANNWIPLNDTVIDNTNNLSQSGLVILPLPGDETLVNTRADSGLVWVKAVVQQTTDAVCRIIAIIPNAAEAVFVQQTNPNVQFTANIPASTISKLSVADGAIKQIAQPYPSFGGIPAESKDQFNQRVSERLRHKQRAVTAWDYERLVLQYFPQIHKVKCLNHTYIDTTIPAYSELKPGHVLIVTIPDLQFLTGANQYLPFTNKGLLTQIQQFLVQLTSKFVQVHVENPLFEGIQVDFQVSFIAGADANFYRGQLDLAIQRYLMPWASGSPDQDINFGGSIEKSTLLNFVQSQPYVDYVTCFKMNQYIYGITGFANPIMNIDVAVATTARSIFVPYYVPGTPPTANLISSPANCTCNGQ